MSKHITLLNLNYDKEKLLEEFNKANFQKSEEFSHNPYNTAWLKTVINSECIEALRIKNFLEQILECSVTGLFYIQEKNKEILSHTDGRCHTSINLVLSQNPAPICFENKYYYNYQCAILNVGEFLHSVPASSEDRQLVRYVISDQKLDYYKISFLLNLFRYD